MMRVRMVIVGLALLVSGCAGNGEPGPRDLKFGKLSNGLECAIAASRTEFNPTEGTEIHVYLRNRTDKPIAVPPLYGRVTEPAGAPFPGYFHPGVEARLTVPRHDGPFHYPHERDPAVPPGEKIMIEPGATRKVASMSFYDVYRLFGISRFKLQFLFDTEHGGFADGSSNVLWLSIVHNLGAGSRYSMRLAAYAAEHVTLATVMRETGACVVDALGTIDCVGRDLRIEETLAGPPRTGLLEDLRYRVNLFRGEHPLRKGERVILFHSTLWVGHPVFKIAPATKQNLADARRAIAEAAKDWGEPVNGLRAGITVGEGPFTTKKPPRFAFRVENVGTVPVRVVKSLIGSAQRLRYPYCTFEVKGPDGTVRHPLNEKYAANFRKRKRRPISSFAVKPAQKFDPYMYTYPDYKLPHLAFDVPGKYEVTFIYSTDSADPDAWWSPEGKELPQITRFTVRSNTVTVEVLPAE